MYNFMALSVIISMFFLVWLFAKRDFLFKDPLKFVVRKRP